MRLVESNPAPAHPPQWAAFKRLVEVVLDRALQSESTQALRQQRLYATITEIDYTGHGFYAQISLRDGEWQRAERSGVIDGGLLSAAPYSKVASDWVGAIVYVKDGLLDCIEAHGNPDWPADVSRHQLIEP